MSVFDPIHEIKGNYNKRVIKGTKIHAETEQNVTMRHRQDSEKRHTLQRTNSKIIAHETTKAKLETQTPIKAGSNRPLVF